MVIKIVYPAQIDDSISIPIGVDNVTNVTAEITNRLRAAIIAIEGELGLKPSGIYGTVRARLDALEGAIDSIGTITLSGDLGGTSSNVKVIGFQGRPIDSTAPAVNQSYVWSGTQWTPETVGTGGGGGGNRSLTYRGTGLFTPNIFGPPIGGILTAIGGSGPLQIIFDSSSSSGPNGSGPSLWFTHENAGHMSRIDLTRNNLVNIPYDDKINFSINGEASIFTLSFITTELYGIWVPVISIDNSANLTNYLINIDRATNAVVEVITLPSPISGSAPPIFGFITFDNINNKLVLGDIGSNNLYTVDPVSKIIGGPIAIGSAQDIPQFFGALTSLLFAQGWIWLLVFNSGTSTGSIFQIDPTTFSIQQTFTPGGAGNGLGFKSLVSDEADGKIFFVDTTTSTLYRIDVLTSILDTINVGNTTLTVGMGSADNLWVATGTSAGAQQITGLNGTLTLGIFVPIVSTTDFPNTPALISITFDGSLLWATDIQNEALWKFQEDGSNLLGIPITSLGRWVKPGTSGQVLTSAGPGSVPFWTAAASVSNAVVFSPTSTTPSTSIISARSSNQSPIIGSPTGAMNLGSDTTSSTSGVSGNYAQVLGGDQCVANADYSTAVGIACTASGQAAFATGNGTIASGNSSHAEGEATVASGEVSHAEGSNTAASNQFAHAEGSLTAAQGNSSHAEGQGSMATGQGSHAEGSSNASNLYAHAEGDSTAASGTASHSEGLATKATGNNSHAEGRCSGGIGGLASGLDSHSEGTDTTASGQASHAEGISGNAGTTGLAFGTASHSEGIDCVASGDASHAEGQGTTASGLQSHAEGLMTVPGRGAATAQGAHVEGEDCLANGNFGHAEGQNTTSTGSASHSEGINTTANGNASHAEGQSTNVGVVGVAAGRASHSEGIDTIANNDGAHAEGTRTIAGGFYAHAEGENTQATAEAAHSEGLSSIASGVAAHAEGSSTALASAAHSEGSSTIASGEAAHAEGAETLASGSISHASGSCSIASRESQDAFASGRFTTNGDAQTSRLVFRGTTPGSITNESVELLYFNPGSKFIPEDGHAYTIEVVAIVRTATGGVKATTLKQTATFHRESGTTVLDGSNTVENIGDATFTASTIQITVGTTPDRIMITFFTGTGTTLACSVVAKVEFTEVF